MRQRFTPLIMWLLLFLFSLPSWANHTSYQIPKDSVRAVVGDLQLVGGHLSIAGGSPEILEADFTSSNPQWLPKVDYYIQEEKGILSLQQPLTIQGLTLSPLNYSWEIRLGDTIPLALQITLGAALGEMDFTGTSLTTLQVNTGVGDVHLNLNQTSSLSSLELRMGMGSLELSLLGPRENDVEVVIWGGIGRATIYLPREVGVLVDIKGGLGRIRAQDFFVHDSTYMNEAYQETEPGIYLEIRAGLGEIRLIQEDLTPTHHLLHSSFLCQLFLE